MSIITLTTDYGLKDHFVGVLKGKIVSDFPEVCIIDISHNIDHFNIAEASYIINAAYSSFPEGTVHLIGVDSERTRESGHIAMQWNNHFFICADNGILSMLTHEIPPQQIVEINIHDKLPGNATDMEVFKTVACHLAKGGRLNEIGVETTKLKFITDLIPQISNSGNTIKGHVIYVDHFGNTVVNITQELFQEVGKGRAFEIDIRPKPINTIQTSYAAVAVLDKFSLKDYEGTRLAIFNEAGYLEIALYRSSPNTTGSASSLLGIGYRDVVTINFFDE